MYIVCAHTHTLHAQLFFAKVLRSATEDEVRALFSQYGKVYDVNLFRAFQGAPTTKVRDVLCSSSPSPSCCRCCCRSTQTTHTHTQQRTVISFCMHALYTARCCMSQLHSVVGWYTTGLNLDQAPDSCSIPSSSIYLDLPQSSIWMQHLVTAVCWCRGVVW